MNLTLSFWLGFVPLLITGSLYSSTENGLERIIFNGINTNHSLNIDIYHVFLKAQRENSSVQMIFFSNTPIRYSLTKCNQVLWSTWGVLQMQKIVLQEEWIDRILNFIVAKCDGTDSAHSIKFDLFPENIASGGLTFQTFEKQTGTHKNVALVPFLVNKEANGTSAHETYINDAIMKALSSETHTLHLVADLTSSVIIRIGKCGMVLPESIILHNNDDVVVNNELLKSMHLLSKLRCAPKYMANVFETRVTTIERTTGIFFFEVVNYRSGTTKATQKIIHLFLIFAVSTSLIIFMYGGWKLMESYYSMFFGPQAKNPIHFENNEMQSVFYDLDSPDENDNAFADFESFLSTLPSSD